MTSPHATVARPSPVLRRAALGMPARRSDHLASLDGLRALAVVAVVAYHLGHLGGGFLGVDVFFVLSGFLITRLLLAERERTGGVDLRAFWRRRFRRLLPPLLVMLPAVTVAARLWLPGWRLPGIRADALAALAYFANWRFVLSDQSYFAQGVEPSPLRHTWSLGIEEQFYVVWPLLVLLALRLAPRSVRGLVLVVSGALMVASASWMAWAAGGSLDLTRIYYGTDTRIFAMCAGATLATFWDPLREWVGASPRRGLVERRAALVASAALVGVVGLFVVGSDTDADFYRWGFQAAALLSAVAIAGLALGRGAVADLLSSDLARWVGRRSYGIYLWSWPVQVFARAQMPDALGPGLDLAIVAVTVGLAALSYRYVEQPILTGRPVLPVALPSRRRLLGRREQVSENPSTSETGALTRVLRPASAVVAVVAVLLVSTVGTTRSPTVFAVTDDEARDVALRAPGFAGAIDQEVASGEAVRGASVTSVPEPDDPVAPPELIPDGDVNGWPWPDDALDPGSAPPFDPHGPLVVSSSDGDPAAVHGRPLRVVVLGDSVAWTLGWELDEGLDPGVVVSNRALIGCGMMPVDSRWGLGSSEKERYGRVCESQGEAEERGFADDGDVILMWLGAWEVFDHEWRGEELTLGSARYAEVLEEHLQRRIDRARQLGTPVVLAVVPCMSEVPEGRYAEARMDPARVRWVNERIAAVARRNPGWVRLIDPNPQLCDEEGNPKRLTPEGEVIRPDGAHFEHSTAVWLWNDWMAGTLASALSPSG